MKRYNEPEEQEIYDYLISLNLENHFSPTLDFATYDDLLDECIQWGFDMWSHGWTKQELAEIELRVQLNIQ